MGSLQSSKNMNQSFMGRTVGRQARSEVFGGQLEELEITWIAAAHAVFALPNDAWDLPPAHRK
jgi:hypothetical protein